MNALSESLAPDLGRALATVGQIARLRATARAKEISALSHGAIVVTDEQMCDMTDQIQGEMLRDLVRDARASISFYIVTNTPLKAN